ncbi:MAG: glycerate kinase [Clostridia bacterium]|nr:glycerate kinase [Clostridia bacterium]
MNQHLLTHAHTIIRQSIAAVLPDEAVRRALADMDLPPRVTLVAIGKAAWRMAAAAQSILGSRITQGVVVTKYGHSEGALPGLEIIEAGHPVPDENSIRGAARALDLVSGLSREDAVLFLISGGGSALFEAPLPGASLGDIAALTRQLLACGASIAEINAVRKHLSAVKGGRFAMACAPASLTCIVLSDVLGDAPDVIASGPAAPDASTCADVQAIIRKYALTVPEHLLPLLATETPKALERVTSIVTGSVSALCEAAAGAARSLGYVPLVLTTTLDCEAREAGAMMAAIAREIRRSGSPISPPCAVIAGGETVVHLRGTGLGGRSQELALAAAKGLDGLQSVCLLALGSDGTDGPTDAAGGIVTGGFAAACRARGLSIDAALQNNDAYPLLKEMDALIMTGPTGTNVNDVCVLLIK